MLSGVLDYKGGSVRISSRDLKDYSSKQLAQVIAVLPQHSSLAFSYTVKETVSLGRYAHQSGWFHSWSAEDESIVQRVMEQTGVAIFRIFILIDYQEERQRSCWHRPLPKSRKSFLDEPTNHLDLSYQKDLLDLMRKMAKERS